MNANLDIAVLGFSSWDYLSVVPHIPADDKVRIAEYLEQGGGPGATAAVAAVRLGVRTGLITAVGDDVRGRLIIEELRRENVNVDGCEMQRGAISPVGFCWVDQHTRHRSIAWHSGTTTALDAGRPLDDLLRGAKVLHLDGHHPEAAAVAIDLVHRRGGIVSFDAGTYTENNRRLVDQCDVVIASEKFAHAWTGGDDVEAAVRGIAVRGPRIVMVTLGSRGVVCLARNQILRRPAFAVDVVDTTGAGDVFHGAFCVGLVEGWGIEESIDFASAAAAMKCTRLGGRTGIPDRAAVMKFLEAMKKPQ